MSSAFTEAPANVAGAERPPRTLLGIAEAADPTLLALLAIALAGAIALVLALGAGVVGISAVPAVLHTGAAGVVLFGVCGYAPARVLVRGALEVYRPLLVLPIGAALSSLALAVLGLLHVPFYISLALVAAGGLLSCAQALRSRRPWTEGTGGLRRAALPLALAAIVAAISMIPIFRSGLATIPGQNGDAVLVAGSAVLVEHAPPTTTRLDLPINRIPLQWRSKYPIYYALAAVSTLAAQTPIQAFAALSGLILAFTALGWFVFARYALRAPPAIALLALFILPLDRIVMYVTIHPYYNELWGQLTLPFMLLAGWQFLTEPSRASAGLFACFLLLGLLAYPLMLPFPLFFLLAGALVVWRRRREAGERVRWLGALNLPPLHRRPLVLIPAVIVAIPVAAVLVRGFAEKVLSALSVLAPWTSLAGWHGTALGYIPWPRFIGMPGAGFADYVGLAIVCGLAALGLRRTRNAAGLALAAMVLATALVGVYFRIRTDGQLFFFKDLAFLGPYVLLVALIELGALAASRARGAALLGLAGAALALVVVPASAAAEINATFDQATPAILALHGWDRALPRGTSVRIDVPPSGVQLWTTYMFNDHPVSALNPLGGFFPHPPAGRKADYVIAERSQPRPADAIGSPLFENEGFALWRMNPAVPGPDVSSRVQTGVTSIVTGF